MKCLCLLCYSDLESDQDEDENEESFESDKVELNAPPEKKKRKQSQAKSSDEPYSNIPFTFTSKFQSLYRHLYGFGKFMLIMNSLINNV